MNNIRLKLYRNVSERAKTFRQEALKTKILEERAGRTIDVDRLNQILEDLRKQ